MNEQLHVWQPDQLSPEQCQKLEPITRRIKETLQRTAEDIIQIGKDLAEAKETLVHGQFSPWLKAEFDMSHQTANRFMHVAQHFGDKLSTVLSLSRRALYELAAPSTSDDIRATALQKLDAGEPITFDEIKEIKEQEQAKQQDKETYRPLTRTIHSFSKTFNALTSQVQQEFKSASGSLDEESRNELVAIQTKIKELEQLVQDILSIEIVQIEPEELAKQRPTPKPKKPTNQKNEMNRPSTKKRVGKK